MRRMQVDKLGIDLLTHDPVIVLKDMEGKRYLPILIGPFEATAIALALEGTQVPRPLSHDLMKSIIDSLKGKVQKVVIHDIKDNTFYARIMIEIAKDKVVEIDARPSDSIALALRVKAPIFVSERIVLEETVVDKVAEEQERKKFKEFLNNLKPSDFLKELSAGSLATLEREEEKELEDELEDEPEEEEELEDEKEAGEEN